MTTTTDTSARRREPLTRDRVLRAAVARADEGGAEALSMRQLAQEFGVVPMALYKHLANKEELLDAMVDAVMGEVNDAVSQIDVLSQPWKPTLRRRILAARDVFLRHPWAPGLMVSRTTMTPAVWRYFDSLIGLFLSAGFSIDLTHHAMHALGSRALGFTQELYDDSGELDADATAMLEQMAGAYPYITAMVAGIAHDADTTLGWCDDQVEFEFALDLLLDGLEAQRAAQSRGPGSGSAGPGS
jgi:AcrR family transcriptional regulator